MTKKELSGIIHEAFQLARNEPDKGDLPGKINNHRSKAWVESLAKKFREFYKGPNSSVSVFSRDYDDNRFYFRLNELLYDVCVCRVEPIPPSLHTKKMFYVKESLWQIESEFSENTKHALVDFNKLVLGSAINKLFVGSQVEDIESRKKIFLCPAKECSGRVFLCLLPHPRKWKPSTPSTVLIWLLSGGDWIEINR